MDIQIKRVYEPYEPSDGYRILVDRLWPRGLTKERVHYDLWAKFLAPSTEARKAFGHKAENFPAFKERYQAELNANDQAIDWVRRIAAQQDAPQTLTLLYAARDPQINHAVVLEDWLARELRQTGASVRER